MAVHFGQKQIDRLAAEGRAELERERRQKTPDPINLEHALALGQPIPLLWRGVEHSVAMITVPQALTLELLQIGWLKRDANLSSEAGVQAALALYGRTAEHFWSLLSPKPKVNPFTNPDLIPLEVGTLFSFFSVCLKIQTQSGSPGAVLH